ncbi:MAG TPA: sigma-70 family RNA polymerase sigma factor [Bryobacteraceae bacterium]|jgi:RNA polymerase sigma-70 factor (ECF subfamily)|nr:sigma-70 family RNA polymerase sigma factor [Bryobacteraceae bacterium]
MANQAAFQRLGNGELRRVAHECPEALTDEEVMLVLCDPDAIPDADTSEYLFAEIFRRYHRRVTTWCFRLTHNRARAHDLAQEIFFKAYRHRHGFRGESRFSTWLYVITRNHCLSSMKKIADPVEVGEAMPLRLRDFSAPPPDILIERRQRHREMWQMIGATLEPMEARVMALHYGYEVPLAAITRRLALTNPSGAKAYVVNARRKLNLVIKRRASRTARTAA